MLIIKSPLRVSLFGGGTDLPEYYTKHGSLIISFALDRSIYLIHNPRPTGGYRLSYSKVEELDSLLEARHTLVRATMHEYKPLPPCTLSIVSDVPKGTGLGSSSALTTALVQLMRGTLKQPQLLSESFALERKVSPVGIQDFLPGIFGNFNIYRIDTSGNVEVTAVPMHLCRLVQQYGLLLYTGIDRRANGILRKVRKSEKELHRIHAVASVALNKLNFYNHITLGEALTETWRHKRGIGGVTSARLDDQFRDALAAGAHGGKLCGAGGGGCWFFIVSPVDRPRVKKALGLAEISFSIGGSIQELAL